MSRSRLRNLEGLLLPYQRHYVNDERRFKIWIAARQVGKSTAVAYESVLLASARPKTAVLLVSASQRQSHELLEKVKIWAEALKIGVAPDVVARQTSEELRLVNGSRLVSLPANPDTIRGFTGHVFLDEFAFHQHSAKIWAAVFPITTRGYALRVISTPNGRQNMFHQIWQHGGDLWSRHRVDVHEARRQGLEVDVEALRAGTPDPDIWAQEYECRFLDEATAFLTYDLIAAVENEMAGRPEMAGPGPFYLGADLGRRRDLTVYCLLEQVGDVLWSREQVVLSKTSFAEQDAELDRLMDRYKPRRVCLDQTGLGERAVEEAKARHGRYRVEGVLFTNPVKQDLALTLRRKFEDRLIRLPADRDLREDLHSVRRSITSAGNIRFDAERTPDGHADRFWALALAVHAAVEPPVTPIIMSRSGRIMRAELKAF
ncbi:MAG: terminase family protein [Thermodesulfobacteriota bacterium]